MVPERWAAIGRGTKDGCPVAYVAREKLDRERRLTVWKLVFREGSWYSLAQWISKGRFRSFPEKNGVKLSDSQTDQTLLKYAESITN